MSESKDGSGSNRKIIDYTILKVQIAFFSVGVLLVVFSFLYENGFMLKQKANEPDKEAQAVYVSNNDA